MQFIYNNEPIERQISYLLQKVKRMMNGEAVASMQAKGVNYARNFGVAIPDLRQIAKQITPNADLASRLWKMDLREAKILATMLFPYAEMTNVQAKKWIKECVTLELREQAAMHLFSHLPFAIPLSLECISSNHEGEEVIGYLTLIRLAGKLSLEQAHQCMLCTLKAAKKAHASASARYAGMCLAALCRHHTPIAQTLHTISQVSENEYPPVVFDLVKQELAFLEHI